MNIKRFSVAYLAVFGFIFIFDWLFHGLLLADLYRQTGFHWRDQDEMIRMMPWMVTGQGIIALVVCLVFANANKLRNLLEGLKLGAILSLFFIGDILIRYAAEPLPIGLIKLWIVGMLVEFTVAGIITAAVYRPKKT